MNLVKSKTSNRSHISYFIYLLIFCFFSVSCGTIRAGGKGRIAASKTSKSSKSSINTPPGAKGGFYFTNIAAQRH